MEDDPVGLAHDGGQDIQPAAMGHADDDVADAQGAAALDDLLEGRDHGLAAIQAEALGAGEALVQKALEALGLDQLLEDGDLALAGEDDLLVPPLDPLLEPGLLCRVGNVHVLHADVGAVGALEDGEDLAERAGFQAQDVVQEDGTVVVRLGEAVGGRIELGGVALGNGDAKRVEGGPQMPPHPVGPDHHDGAQGIEGGRTDVLRRHGGGPLGDLRCQLGFDGGPEPVDGGQPVRTGGRRRAGGPGRGGKRLTRSGTIMDRGEEAAPGHLDRVGSL